MTVSTSNGNWVVPPFRGIWVPAGVKHEIQMSGSVHMQTLYFATRHCRRVSRVCTVIHITPLFRELILHVVGMGVPDMHDTSQRRMVEMILDQLRAASSVQLQLPLPVDGRARQAVRVLEESIADPSALDEKLGKVGASRRTLERLFRKETGISLGRWYQQLRLLRALRMLAQGESVTSVALDVGYSSPSAFISMFRRSMGTTPGRYYIDGAGI